MKLFVTGVAGQLGHDVVNELSARGHYAIGSDVVDYTAAQFTTGEAPVDELIYEKLDITDEAAVKTVIGKHKPDAIIHCAAWTNCTDPVTSCTMADRNDIEWK